MNLEKSLEQDFELLCAYLYGERVKACQELDEVNQGIRNARERRGIVGRMRAFERREEALVRLMDALDMCREGESCGARRLMGG